MKKILSLILALMMLATAVCFVGCGAKDDNKLTVYTEAGFAPYEFIYNNEIVGVDIAIMKAVAEELGKPFVYVRPKAKDHGMGNQIEGDVYPGAKVVVVEDLVSTGLSSLRAVDALRAAGVEVVGMVASFTYGFGVAAEAFENAGVKLITLTHYEAVVEAAKETNYITEDVMPTLQEWRANPSEWRNDLK